MSILNAIPGPYRLLALGAAAAAVLAGVMGYGAFERHAGEASGRAEVQARWDAAKAVSATTAASAAAANLNETERRLQAQKEIADAAQVQTAQARADADVAGRAAEQLRQRFAAAVAAAGRASPANSSASGPGTAASQTTNLLADVQRRLDEAAGGIGQFADDSSIAGATCERSYDALIQTQKSPD